MVAVTGAVPEFNAVNDAIFPLPVAARPMDVVLLLHVYVVVPPVERVEKSTLDVGPL